MAKYRHYKFNKDTLSFELESITILAKIKRLLVTFLIGSAIAIVWIVVYSLFFNTPREGRILEENRNLLASYDLMQKKFAQLNRALVEMQNRDNKLYRAVFEEDEISNATRNSGINSPSRYVKPEGMSHHNALTVTATQRMLDQLIKKAVIQSRSFDKIVLLASDKSLMQRAMPITSPVDLNRIRLTSFFGGRTDPKFGDYRFHEGLDFAGNVGLPILAAGDGVVTKANYSSGYGNMVELNHGYGYVTRYAHLSAINVREGMRIKRGQMVGALGSTGKSTGPHLHYEVRLKGIPRNPLNYFENTLDAESEELLTGDAMISYGYER